MLKLKLKNSQRTAAAYYFLVFVFGAAPEQATLAIRSMELWQMDELADEGINNLRVNKEAFFNLVRHA